MEYICVKQVQGAVGVLFPVGTIVSAEVSQVSDEIMFYEGVDLSKKTFYQHFLPWTGSDIVKGFEPESTQEQTERSIQMMNGNKDIENAKLNMAKTGYEGFKRRCKEICLHILAKEISGE